MNRSPSSRNGSAPATPDVEVRTSPRRRKTAAGRMEGERIVVVVPASWPPAVRDRVVGDLVARILRKQRGAAASDAELAARAAVLADRYLGGVRPSSVRWVSNQRERWGSCTTVTGALRISDRLRVVPTWVLDAVLVHELAHLLEHGHTARFHELADRYPRQAEASSFLAGFSYGLSQRDTGGEPAPERDCDELEPELEQAG